ncbi:MAG TPA: cadmium-containing carbonic anhydrase [Candidatus Saccharimonadales bacterium]|nr:cadmium-containing carbonic anhydrase [Candidatus Saccharimonadales bacterium]
MEEPKFYVTRITEGLAFGEGGISGAAEKDTDTEVLRKLDEAIEYHSDLLVPVDLDEAGEPLSDDGCGDGRDARLTYRLGQQFKRSLHRAKVFGGALVMGVASTVGLGEARNRPLQELFTDTITELGEKHINFGAHTDPAYENPEVDKCGCGAIDRAPEAMMAALKYQGPIRAVIGALGVNDEGLDGVFQNFGQYVSEVIARHPAYSGKRVMKEITNAGKVIKQLSGEHRERRIILNDVRGYTVNQRLLRQLTDDQAQVFAVDIWRLTDIATQKYAEAPSRAHQALLSELVYTLGIAAVLTKGDLPVYRVQSQG